MLKNEVVRLLKSKSTFVILIMLLIASLSYAISFSERRELIEMYNTSYDADLNRDRLKNVIDSDDGFKFYMDYIDTNDMASISAVVMLLWMGVFISPISERWRASGYGNLLVVRRDYKNVLKMRLLADSIYIAVIMCVTTIEQLLLAVIIGGYGNKGCPIAGYHLNLYQTLLVIIVQMIVMIVFLCVANAITAMLNCFIKNKYIIQIAPFVLFYVIPIMTATVVGNTFTITAQYARYILVSNVEMTVHNIMQAGFGIEEIVLHTVPFVVCVVFFEILKRINIRYYLRN